MQVKITRGEKWRTVVDVELTPAELAPHFDKALRNYQRRVSLQGFRKGKVPLTMVRKLYGEAIQAEVVEEMFPDIFREVRDKEGLKLAAPAKIEDFTFDRQQGVRFRATAEVEPEFEVKKYKGFALVKTVYEIGDEDVAEALERLQDRYASMQEVDGAARFGDFIEADLQEVDAAGLPVIGRKYTDRLFQIAKENDSGDDADELTAQLVGGQKGETRTVKLIGRNDDGTVASSSTLYQVNIKNVKEKLLPVLDDAFVRRVGGFENLDQLRAALRQRLQRDASLRTQNELRNELIDAILKTNPIDLPESVVEHYLASFIADLKKQKNDKLDEAEVREHYRAGVVWNIKWRMLRERLLAQERIALAPGEPEQFVRRSAEARGKDPGREWNRLKNNKVELDRVEQDLLEDKLLAHLLGQQQISEKTVWRHDVQKGKLIVEPG